MFMDVIKSHFKENTPIFRKEIISLFPQYSQIYVCKMIKEAVDSGELAHHSMGIYYIPTQTKFGISYITARDIMTKRYVGYDGRYYGIFSGLSLENGFGLTTQMPATMEIVSNNESSKRREIKIDGMKYIVSKSRVEIDEDNMNVYMLLELFNSYPEESLSEEVKKTIDDFIKEYDISREDIINMSAYFPKKAIKKMAKEGVI
ncbi:MAG: hypothetical protein LUD22_04135 [Coprobacillus sp.]|nr:hypothetical protein [Coprobacillus sp.]